MSETPEAVSVSPDDASSDRAQSDQDHLDSEAGRKAAARHAADNQATMMGAMQALSVAVNGQNGALDRVATAFTASQASARTAARRFAVGTTIGLLTLILFVAAGAVLVLRVRDITSNTNANSQRLVSCTTPEGVCFKQLQSRGGTQEAVNNINQVTVLAAVCAPDYAGLPVAARTAAIRACITRGLPTSPK